MTVRELQERLQKFGPEQEVCYEDPRGGYHRANKLIELPVIYNPTGPWTGNYKDAGDAELPRQVIVLC